MKLKELIPHRPDVRTYLPGQTIPNSCLVGVEIELEQFRGEGRGLTYWRMEHDGSLRDGGVEFVLAQPLTGHDLELALTEINTVINNANFDSNHRCSTHVHIDVRDLSLEHLQKIVFIYSMFERFVYDLVEESREHNFYCAPMYSSLQNRRNIAQCFDAKHFGSCPKYSGINLRTVEKYGSLEFRMHEGVHKDTDIKKWIMFLMKLRSGTQKYEDVPMEQLLQMYSDNSAESVLCDVFGEEFLNTFQTPDPDRLKQSMRAAQDMLLLRHAGSIRHKEMGWRRLGGNNGDIPGIDPEVLEILRNRREEILNR